MLNQPLIALVNSVLGTGKQTSKGNFAYHCPFCNHHKPKLEVNMTENKKGENPWHCWVCDKRGKKLLQIFKQVKASPEALLELRSLVKTETADKEFVAVEKLSLPKEFKPLYEGSTIEFSRVKKYLYSRGLTEEDFIKYEIGYCASGAYVNRVVIPSYDSNGILNFFVSRLAGNIQGVPYKNPAVNKDIIFFESMINWKAPIVLCEGVFDAMAIKRNVIPILGKVVSKKLYERLAHNETKDVYIALDKDALKGALSIADKLLALGKRVFLVDLQEKDPSIMGFKSFTNLISQAEPLTFEKLLTYKLSL